MEAWGSGGTDILQAREESLGGVDSRLSCPPILYALRVPRADQENHLATSTFSIRAAFSLGLCVASFPLTSAAHHTSAVNPGSKSSAGSGTDSPPPHGLAKRKPQVVRDCLH